MLLFYSSVSKVVYVYFFFFQAEDGIRDVAVTGVQTCALPILSRASKRQKNSTSTSIGSYNANSKLYKR